MPATRISRRFDKFRYAKGATPTAVLRDKMQRAMQDTCAVYRTGPVMEEGVQRIAEVWGGVPDISVTDRTMIWNTDLAETLEFDNLIAQAAVTVNGARQPHGMPRRPCARGFPGSR